MLSDNDFTISLRKRQPLSRRLAELPGELCERLYLPAQHHAERRSDERLQDLIGELCDRRGGRRVDERAAERVADDHDDRAEQHADEGCDHGLLLHHPVGAERNGDRLQSVRDERDEHRRRIKEEIAEERADTADAERPQRVKDQRGKADDHVVQIEMSARNGNAEHAHAHNDVHCHQQRRRAEPARAVFRFRCHGYISPCFFLTHSLQCSGYIKISREGENNNTR